MCVYELLTLKREGNTGRDHVDRGKGLFPRADAL